MTCSHYRLSSLITLLALLVFAGSADAAVADLTLVCQVFAVHADGTQTGFLRRLKILSESGSYTQQDDHGAGFQTNGNGMIAHRSAKQIVLRDDDRAFWSIGGDGSYYFKSHVNGNVQTGQCKQM